MTKNLYSISSNIKIDLSKVSFIAIPRTSSANTVMFVVDGQKIELSKTAFSSGPRAFLSEWEKLQKE